MDDAVYLEEGKLVLFTRNRIWQVRIPIDGGRYLWRGLKTSDKSKAQRDGKKLFHQTQSRLEEGLPVQQRTLNSVIDEYVAMRERDNARGKAAKQLSSTKHTQDGNLVIAHPTRTIGSTGSLAASTKRTVSRTEAPLAFAVLTTERKAA